MSKKAERRSEALFDRPAALTFEHAKGSLRRLSQLLYLLGIPVTVLLSNDAPLSS